jgi:hypothetical protein
MSFTPEQRTVVLAAVRSKMNHPCESCGQSDWTLIDYLVSVPVAEIVPLLSVTGRSLPSIGVICTTCGNTRLLNVFYLGVADAFGLTPSAEGG